MLDPLILVLTAIRFIPTIPLVTATEIEGAVHRAVVEAWTLKQAGGALQMPKTVQALPEALSIGLRMGSRFKITGHGQCELLYKDPNLENDILRSLGYTVTGDNELISTMDSKDSEEPLTQVDERYLIGEKPFGSDEGAQETRGEAESEVLLDDLVMSDVESSLDSSEQIGTEDPSLINGHNVLQDQMSQEAGLNFDQSWQNVSLKDPATKFAVCLRF